MSNWNKIKFDLLEHIKINNITNFLEFHESLKSLDKNIKGVFLNIFVCYIS
jgi:hypothetical protein